MTAVDNDGVQSVIDKITSTLDPEASNPDSIETDPNGDPGVGEGPNEPVDEQTGDPKATDPEEDAKAARAFAAMRVQNKELTQMVEQLTAELDAIKKGTPTSTETTDETAPQDPLAIKETDTEEVKALKALVSELKKDTDVLKEDRTVRLNREQEQRVVGELTQLRDKYGLDKDGLLKFADDAERAGFVLGQTNLSLEQVYTLVYHEDLVAAAVRSVEQRTNDGLAPGTGPGATGGTGSNAPARPRDVVAGIIKDLKLN